MTAKSAPARKVVPLTSTPTPKPDVIVGMWNGMPNWQCTRCPYSTVDGENAIRQHIADQHLAEVQTVEQRARASGIIIAR